MPNWCHNVLTVQGTSQAMKKFYKLIGDDIKNDFLMNKLLPIPEELLKYDSPNIFRPITSISPNLDGVNQVDEFGMTKSEHKLLLVTLINKYGFDNWYDWCCDNWGCKWDMDNLSVLEKDNIKLKVDYWTPWDPNLEFIELLSLVFRKLKFELVYSETGMWFAGKLMIHDETYSHDNLNLGILSFVPYGNGYKYISDEEIDEYDTYYQVTFIGDDWVRYCNDDGFSKETVLNWNELEQEMKSDNVNKNNDSD